MLNKTRILYLKDPTQDNPDDLNLGHTFLIHILLSSEKLLSAIENFQPHFVVHSPQSPVSSREVIEIIELIGENAPLVITLIPGNVEKLRPLLHNFTPAVQNKDLQFSCLETGKPGFPENLFLNSPIPYLVYDRGSMQILDVNRAAVETYHYGREEFLALSIQNIWLQGEIPNSFYPKEGDRSVIKGIHTHLSKNNEEIRVEVYQYPITYDSRSYMLLASINITEKEKAVSKLAEKHSRLSAAQEIAKMGYWEYNIHSQDLFLSDMVFRMWGQTKSSENPGLSFISDAIHPEDRENYLKIQNDSFREGKIHNIEYRIIQPSGELKWIKEHGRVLTWKGERASTVERIIQDITEEKNFLEKLSTSEARYKGIIKSQTNYLIRTDMLGNYTYHNDKFLEDFGWLYRENEILGQQSLSSIMEYHHEAVKNVVVKCIMAPGSAFQLEIDKPRKKGKIRSTLWDFVCLVDTKGNPTEIQCVGIDISQRVRTQKQLKESKLRYKLVTKATSDAIWDWDLNSGVMYWGKTLKSMFGYDPRDFTRVELWDELIFPEDSPRIKMELKEVLRSKSKKWLAEYRLKKSDGTYAYVLEKATILRDKNNRAYRLVGALQDITEKKKLQDLLENANMLSRIGSFELDLKNENLYWSPMTREIHGVDQDYTPSLASAINFYKKGKTRNKLQRVLRETIKYHKPYDIELQITTAGAKEVWVRVIGQPEVEDGVCIKINGSFQDIDKVKRAEQEVLKAAKEKQTLLESIGDAFFAMDRNWIVTYWNNHAEGLLNCPKSKILKRNLWEIFPDAIDTAFQHNYEETLKDKKKRHFEAYFHRTSSWYEVTVYPSAEGLSIFFRDITPRKLAEGRNKELNKSLRAYTRELVTANKGLEQFSYIVSHNLRSPVANIKGLSHLLQNDDYPQEVREQLFDQVFSNVDRLDAVITDLNNILQVKTNIKASKERIDLFELVNGIRFSIQHLIRESGAVVLCDFETTASIVSVKSYLHSIFYNLLLNSLKYRRPDVLPVIEIGARTKGEFIIITFRDNGLGIDLPAKEDQIFNLYKRFHHHVEGKGMGLFMVKTQIEMLGGKISLVSEINKGTTFTIVLKENNPSIEKEYEKTMSLSDN